MRTTVTLEDDVAAALARIERQEGKSAKEIINAALREFIARRARRPRAEPYRTPVVDLGPCLIASIEDVSEALALSEGDDFR
jgi:hypothetical protein